MAMETVGAESVPANITLKELRHVAGALRRLNEIDSAPVLTVDDRLEIARAKAACWTVVGSAAEALVSLMDAMAGDLDLENDTGAEDAFEDHNERYGYDGPGDPVDDPGGGNVEDEGEAIDEREPDHDAEIETWSHPDDHPAELWIGEKPPC